MNTLAFLATLPLLSTIVWNRHYDFRTRDVGNAVIQLGTDYVTVGTTGHNVGYLFVQKVDSLGNQTLYKEWVHAAGYDIKKLQYGYIILAYKYQTREGIWLVRTDENFDTLWTRVFRYMNDYTRGYSVDLASDGGFVITGSARYDSWWGFDVLILKTDSLGNETWSKVYGGRFSDGGNYIEEISDGGYIVTGTVEGSPWDDISENEQVLLLKLNENGDTLWSRTYGYAKRDEGYCVRETSDKGFIISGETQEEEPAGAHALWLIKTDSLGNKLWDIAYGYGFYTQGASFVEEIENGYVAVGSREFVNEDINNLLILKTDKDGNILWARDYGLNGWDEGICIHQTADQGFIVCGRLEVGDNRFDLWLLKTDSLGYTDSLESIVEKPEVDRLSSTLFSTVSGFCYSLPLGEQGTLRVYDIKGALITSKAVYGDGNINLQDFPSGVYFGHLETSKRIETEKAVITNN
jgi:hypothetical protein